MNVARIAVLGVAIVAGGFAAMLAGGRDPQPAAPTPAPAPRVATTDVLVAASDINMGDKVSAQALSWQAWPSSAANSAFIKKSAQPDAIEQLAGSIARAPFAAGEPIREARLIKAGGSGYMAAILPSGMRAIATQISPETGAGGFILPNDHVDVILTRRDRASEKATGLESHTSEIILSNVRVLAIDQTVEDKNGTRVAVGRTATLELTPSQAETLSLSQQLGTLSLALRSLVDFKGNGPQASAENDRRGGVNMVRFGVSTMTPTTK